MESLKILHIAPFFYGGVGTVAYSLTKEFAKIGCEVILTTPAEVPLELKNFTKRYYTLLKPSLKDPFYSFQFYILNKERIKKIIELEKPDVILTHGPLVAIAKNIKTIPVFSIVHGTYANEIKWMRYHPIPGLSKIKYIIGIYTTHYHDTTLYKSIMQHDNVYLIAVSKKTKKELINAGIPSNRVFTILNGVYKERFKLLNKDFARALIEDKFKVCLKDKVILHINPGPRKGTHTLIRAVAILERFYGENFTLLIAGRLGPKSYKEHIENIIEILKLKSVKLLGYVEDEILPILYNTADLTVVSSYSEGSPLVIPESLACKVPVVATNVGGNSEYLELVHLKSLIIEIMQYDFSKELALKILETFTISNSKDINNDNLPSWNEITMKYYEVIRNLT
jgi:glycosyltransferase involved in cell wall biosynthesis